MHFLLMPFIAVGFTSKILSKRLFKNNSAYEEQLQYDYIFATIVNSINLEDELDENKKIWKNKIFSR